MARSAFARHRDRRHACSFSCFRAVSSFHQIFLANGGRVFAEGFKVWARNRLLSTTSISLALIILLPKLVVTPLIFVSIICGVSGSATLASSAQVGVQGYRVLPYKRQQRSL